MSKDLTGFQAEGLLPYKINLNGVELLSKLKRVDKDGTYRIFYSEDGNISTLQTIGYSWLECVVKTAASLYQQDVISQSEHSQIIEKALSLVGYKVNDKRI